MGRSAGHGQMAMKGSGCAVLALRRGGGEGCARGGKHVDDGRALHTVCLLPHITHNWSSIPVGKIPFVHAETQQLTLIPSRCPRGNAEHVDMCVHVVLRMSAYHWSDN